MNFIQLFNKEFTVFSIHNGSNWCTQHLDTVLCKHTRLFQFHTTIERCLPTEREQNAIRMFLLNNPFYEIRLHRKKVNPVSNAFRSLDCSNIRIDKNGLNTLLMQCFKRL